MTQTNAEDEIENEIEVEIERGRKRSNTVRKKTNQENAQTCRLASSAGECSTVTGTWCILRTFYIYVQPSLNPLLHVCPTPFHSPRMATPPLSKLASFTSGRLAPRSATARARKDGATVVAWTWTELRAFMGKPGNLRVKASVSINDMIRVYHKTPLLRNTCVCMHQWCCCRAHR